VDAAKTCLVARSAVLVTAPFNEQQRDVVPPSANALVHLSQIANVLVNEEKLGKPDCQETG
jgi:hypothetical protein